MEETPKTAIHTSLKSCFNYALVIENSQSSWTCPSHVTKKIFAKFVCPNSSQPPTSSIDKANVLKGKKKLKQDT